MKRKALSLFASLSLSQLLFGQNDSLASQKLREFNNDTVRFIKQYIVARKESYIGKPLDSLLKDLPLVLSYTNGDIFTNRNLCPSTTLHLLGNKQFFERLSQRKNPSTIGITWITPLDFTEMPGAGLKEWGGIWTQAAINYYKNKIIGDISTLRED